MLERKMGGVGVDLFAKGPVFDYQTKGGSKKLF